VDKLNRKFQISLITLITLLLLAGTVSAMWRRPRPVTFFEKLLDALFKGITFAIAEPCNVDSDCCVYVSKHPDKPYADCRDGACYWTSKYYSDLQPGKYYYCGDGTPPSPTTTLPGVTTTVPTTPTKECWNEGEERCAYHISDTRVEVCRNGRWEYVAECYPDERCVKLNKYEACETLVTPTTTTLPKIECSWGYY